jgi:hypothetical protein
MDDSIISAETLVGKTPVVMTVTSNLAALEF